MKAKVWKYTKEKTKQESSFHCHVKGKKERKKRESSYGQRKSTRLKLSLRERRSLKNIKVFASRIKIVSIL
jgi:hypothetical protein